MDCPVKRKMLKKYLLPQRKNKTGTSQVGAIPKAQKAQKVFEICRGRCEKLTKTPKQWGKCLSWSENASENRI